MAFEIKGAVIAIKDEKSGTNKATGNPWRFIEVIIEELADYPNSVAIQFWNDKADFAEELSVGQVVHAMFNIKTKEYNGNHYMNATFWKFSDSHPKADQSQQAPPAPSHYSEDPQYQQAQQQAQGGDEDLPPNDLPF